MRLIIEMRISNTETFIISSSSLSAAAEAEAGKENNTGNLP
jgi:hypothetical protein